MPSFLRRKKSTSSLQKSKSASPDEINSKHNILTTSRNYQKEGTISGKFDESQRSLDIIGRNAKSSGSRVRTRSASPFRFRQNKEKNHKENKEKNHKERKDSKDSKNDVTSSIGRGRNDNGIRNESNNGSSRSLRSRSFSPFRFRRKDSKVQMGTDNIDSSRTHGENKKAMQPAPKLPNKASQRTQHHVGSRNEHAQSSRGADKESSFTPNHILSRPVQGDANDSSKGFTRHRRPPSMKQMGNDFESRRKISTSQSSYSLTSSTSFDSVMKYPPSKLTPLRKRPARDVTKDPRVGFRGQSIPEEHGEIEKRDDAEKVELDYPVFSNFQKVLEELRLERKYQQYRQTSESPENNPHSHAQKKDYAPSKDENRRTRVNDHFKSVDITRASKGPHLVSVKNCDDTNGSINPPPPPIVFSKPNSLVHGNIFNSRHDHHRGAPQVQSHSDSINTSLRSYSSEEDSITQLVVQVPLHGPSNAQEIDQFDLIHTPRPSSNTPEESSDTQQRRSSLLQQKSQSKKRIARKKMSTTKSKSIRRLFKSQPQDDRSADPTQERRRNFAFMKSTPSRRKASTATLERTRARAKQLAEFAVTPDASKRQIQDVTLEQDFFAMHSASLDYHFEDNTRNPVGLNFAALDNESVISGMSSVHDLDVFDEQSVYSTKSHFSSMRGKSSRPRKNRLQSFGSSSRRQPQQPQQYVDMFEANFDDAFHPVNMKNRLEAQNGFSAVPSETGSMSFSFAAPSSGRSKQNPTSSGASVVSTGSSVSGVAARRLMRRGMNSANQSQFSSNGSVTSEKSERSQYSERTESSDRGHTNQGHYSRGQRPPTSPTPFMPKDVSMSGFTFNAFGLDEHEIDNDVNAAIAELEETNPDISLFMNSHAEDFHSYKGGSKGTVSTHAMTATSNQHQRQAQHTQAGIPSISVDREISVASTLTKSSESDPLNTHGNSKQFKHSQNFASFDGKNRAHDGHETLSNVGTSGLGRRNTQTLRDVKERIKAKHQSEFRSVDLPDIEPRESEDTNEAEEEENPSTFDADFRQIDGAPSEEFGNFDDYNAESNRGLHDDSLGKRESVMRRNDQKTASSEESQSSEEVTHFIPRNARTAQDEAATESQRRALNWASERSEPIVMSPLLIPNSRRVKKVTPSQRRAKDWARESPGSPDDVVDRALPSLKAEQDRRRHLDEHSGHDVQNWEQPPLPARKTLAHRTPNASLKHHTAEPRIRDEEDLNSFASEDLEVQQVLKPKYISRIGQQLPIPTEKIILRRTESPVLHPDYDRYKTVAPKVSLRKVETNAPKAVQESPNYLATIKLRKVNTPAPPVEGDSKSTDEVNETDYDNEKVFQNYEQYSEESIAMTDNSELEMSPSDDLDISNNPKRSTDVVNKRADLPVHMSAKIPRNGYSSPPSSIHAASKTNQSQGGRISNAKVIEQANTLHLHPIAASFAARSQEVSPLKQELLVEDEGVPYNSVAALFASRSQQVARPNHGKVKAEPAPMSASALPIAALTAARANAQKIQGGTQNNPGVEDEPLVNNVAGLFAQRSATMAPSRTNINAEEESEKDNGKLLLLFSQRPSAAKVASKPDDNVQTSNPALSTKAETAPRDFGGKPALKDDPMFTKYFKMLKMGLPLQVVKHALTRDGFDAEILDGDHNQPAGSMSEPDGVPLKEDPRYTKYFKMIKMGLPMGAVKNAMDRDGEDGTVMDGDHNAPAKGGNKPEAKKAEPIPKDKFRRTRVHWDTHEEVKSTSVWAMVNQDPDVEDIEIDESEFAELFQAEVGKTLAIDSNASKKTNAVKVIDPKRANNGGIVLARLKITYEEMAVAIDTINDKAMNVEQVQGILEYIPTKDEKHSLRKYMTSSDKDSADAFDELCECEKFMVAMMTVKHSKEKVRALLFKLQFRQCVNDLESDVSLVENACDELKESVRLRKLLGIVLNLGNRLNTAGPTTKGKAGAFAIESLLKLNQAKAFDKKTTFLHYIVLVVLRQNGTLADFKDDLPSVLKADKIYWDQIENDLEEVESQLENVRKIALHEFFGKRKSRKNNGDDDDISQNSMSLEEEVEALRSTRIGIFTLQAIKIVSSLRENVEITRSKFKKVLEYFGEDDKKKMNPHDLFEIISVFAKDFSAAKKAVIDIEKEKARQNRKKQGHRSQSPSTRSRDSSWSRASKEPETPTRTEKPLRASSMQPHINIQMSRQGQAIETEEESRAVHNSYYSNESSALQEEAESIRLEEEEKSCSDPSYNYEQSDPSEPEEHGADQVWTNDESYSQEDSENQVPTAKIQLETEHEQWHQTEAEEQEEYGEHPSKAFRRNANDYHDVNDSLTKSHSQEYQEQASPENTGSQPDEQNTRFRARAMRQHRIRSVKEAPVPTKRRPPTPEYREQPTPPLRQEDNDNPSPRLMSRRERLVRRQRHFGNQI